MINLIVNRKYKERLFLRIFREKEEPDRELMAQCQRLKEYAQFIARVREYQTGGMPAAQAVEAALDSCIAQGILVDILSKHRAEVIDMFLADYDEEYRLKLMEKDWREESWKEGREEGKKEGKKEGTEEGLCLQLVRQVRKKMAKAVPEADIADMLEEDVEQVAAICRQIREHPEWEDLQVCKEIRKT